MRRSLLHFFLFVLSLNLTAQLKVTTGLTVEEYLERGFIGSGIEIVPGSVTYFGDVSQPPLSQIGLFNSINANVGIDSGIVMATSEVDIAIGPNHTQAVSGSLGGFFNSTPDADMDSLIKWYSLFPGFEIGSFDKCVVEFDFVPKGNNIEFIYVFGSEEYSTWVATDKNDVFAFLLSGPGINGPFTRNAINLATVPGTDIPVSINSIHDSVPASPERPFSVPAMFPEYYVDNGDGEGLGLPIPEPFLSDPYYIQFNGLTTPLTAQYAVQCGETYHFKAAITDVGDGFRDAGVFFTDFSSNGTGVEITKSTNTGTDTIPEGQSATFTFTRVDTNLSQPLSVYYEITGTATNGADYTRIVVDSIRFPVGTTEQRILIETLVDFPLEIVETLVVNVLSTDPCGNPTTSSEILYIVDGNERLEPIVTAPNVITPNGDGFNDNLIFTDLDNTVFPESFLKIFNRWGRKVHEEKGYNNTWSPEKELSDGTYYYILELGNEASTVLKGSFTILH